MQGPNYERRLAWVGINAELLHRLMNLPDDVRVRNVVTDAYSDTIRVVLESDRFNLVAPFAEAPAVVGALHLRLESLPAEPPVGPPADDAKFFARFELDLPERKS